MSKLLALMVGPLWVLTACGGAAPTEEMSALAAVAGTDRPLKGVCQVAVVVRTHDAEDDGGCSGGNEEDSGNGPPIARHYEVTGTCQLAHLGLVGLSGRLNVTGPFGMGGHEGGSEVLVTEGNEGTGGGLAVRGRLALLAANGDQLTGRYVPVSASFAPAPGGNGGTLSFGSTFKAGESCEGPGDHEIVPAAEDGHEGDHEEPVSTGRFATATGEAYLFGNLMITSAPKQGSGTLLVQGLISY